MPTTSYEFELNLLSVTAICVLAIYDVIQLINPYDYPEPKLYDNQKIVNILAAALFFFIQLYILFSNIYCKPKYQLYTVNPFKLSFIFPTEIIIITYLVYGRTLMFIDYKRYCKANKCECHDLLEIGELTFEMIMCAATVVAKILLLMRYTYYRQVSVNELTLLADDAPKIGYKLYSCSSYG